jgi:hypothetical protein
VIAGEPLHRALACGKQQALAEFGPELTLEEVGVEITVNGT